MDFAIYARGLMYNERLTMSSQNLTVIDASMNVSRRIHSSLQSDGPNIKPNGLCCARIALITPEPHEARSLQAAKLCPLPPVSQPQTRLLGVVETSENTSRLIADV